MQRWQGEERRTTAMGKTEVKRRRPGETSSKLEQSPLLSPRPHGVGFLELMNGWASG